MPSLVGIKDSTALKVQLVFDLIDVTNQILSVLLRRNRIQVETCYFVAITLIDVKWSLKWITAYGGGDASHACFDRGGSQL